MKTAFLVFQIMFLLNLLGCATPRTNPNMPQLISDSEYESVIASNSDKKQVYDGFYAVMEVSGTMINSKVLKAQLEQRARIYQWTPEILASEKVKQDAKMAKETEFFISFFVPERKHDDLHKAKTLWKLFLDANGRRYEGKSSRMKTILSDVVSLYPQHNRWSTPYIVSFPVPVSMIENGGAILTITGPAGSTTLSFKAVP